MCDVCSVNRDTIFFSLHRDTIDPRNYRHGCNWHLRTSGESLWMAVPVVGELNEIVLTGSFNANISKAGGGESQRTI